MRPEETYKKNKEALGQEYEYFKGRWPEHCKLLLEGIKRSWLRKRANGCVVNYCKPCDAFFYSGHDCSEAQWYIDGYSSQSEIYKKNRGL